jgi:hypothetical protein
MTARSASASKEKRANGEGSVYTRILKSGKKRYIAAAKDINGKLCRKSFQKASEAHDHLYKMKQDRLVGRNTFAVNPKMTVTEFLEAWLSNRANLKPETRRNYQGAITNRITHSNLLAMFKIEALRCNLSLTLSPCPLRREIRWGYW